MFLLDTNVCIAFLKKNDRALTKRILETPREEVALCSTVKGELLYGARASAKVDANLKRLEEFFAPLQSLPTTTPRRSGTASSARSSRRAEHRSAETISSSRRRRSRPTPRW